MKQSTKVIIFFFSRGNSNSVIVMDQSKKSDFVQPDSTNHAQPLKLLQPPKAVKLDASAPAVNPKSHTPTSTDTSSTWTVSSSPTQTRDTKHSDLLKTFR